MRKTLQTLCLGIGVMTLSIPAWGQPPRVYKPPSTERNVVRFELGYFEPSGDSAYWTDKRREFTGSVSDYSDYIFGFDYIRMLNPRFGVVVSSTFWEGMTDQSYIAFEDAAGLPISHTTTVETSTFNLGVIYYFLPREAPVAPYLGFGGGYLGYRLEESGDFIDFSLVVPEIFTDTFVARGDTYNYYAQFGLDIPVSHQFSVLTEARWQSADDELSDDFQGLGRLDLSGWDVRAGMSWRF